MLLEAIRGVSAWDGMGEMSAEEITARLSDDQIDFLLQMQEAEAWDEKYRKFDFLFPDKTMHVGSSTYHARNLYQRHLEFFRLGAKIRARCFMAGNRCISPWSFIQTASGERPAAEVLSEGYADVLSWDGEVQHTSQMQGGFLKGIEPAYRLVMASGRFVDCSRSHRLLTASGWISLDRLMSRADGLRWSQRREDYQANCEADGYLGDLPLPKLGGIDLASLPSSDGVQKRSPLAFSLTDEAAQAHRHILSDPGGDRLTSQDDLLRLSDLFSLLSGPSSSSPVLSLSARTLALAQLAAELGQASKGGRSPAGQFEYRNRAFLQKECLAGSCMPIGQDASHLFAGLSLCDQPLAQSVEELLHDAGRIEIFFPSQSPDFIGGERLICVVPIGLQPIIDMHVPGDNNYLSGGVFNHNCGKTIAGGYEMACHLTGRYPPWWEGRKFRHPIRAWACGKTNETTRDIVQTTLLGDIEYQGSRKMVDGAGVIPKACIGLHSGSVTWKQGVADLIDTIKIQHVSGGWSKLGLKSYQQGRGAFEGTAQHVIWDDEEPPMDVYGEQMIRTATTKGIMMVTFTPLAGLSDVVQQFLPGEDDA